MTRVSIDKAMQLALQHHQHGRLAEAEQIYRQVLSADRNHFEALQLLGTLARQTGHAAAAIQLFTRALAIDPSIAAVWANLAFAHMSAGRADESLAASERALSLDANLASAYLARGAALVELNRFDEAVAMWNRLIEFQPDDAEAHSNLGATLEMMGRIDEAVGCCQRAVEQKPAYAMARVNLGSALLKAGRAAEAAEQLRHAIRLDPKLAPAYVNLATAAQHLGRLDEAAAAARRAAKLNPNDVNSHFAAALHEQEDLDRAASYFATAAKLLDAKVQQQSPSAAAASRRFAACLRLASAALLPAVYESGDDIARWRERLSGGIESLRREHVKVHIDNDTAPTLFALPYQGCDDVAINRAFAGLIAAPPPPPLQRTPIAGRKIRVGFASRFFRNHTIGRLNMGLIAKLSREHFEVIALPSDPSDDDTANFIRAHADQTHALPPSLPAARDLVAKLNLDVLLYTDLGMDPFTYSLAYSRLAPVQCVTWGHPVTSGIDAIDYFISSELLESPGADAQYTEKLVRLPRLAVYYYRPTLTEPPKSRDDFNLPHDANLYGCLQMLWKFHPDFDRALAGVLRRDPRGRVLIIEGLSATWQRRLIARWQRTMGDLVDRITFLPRQLYTDFLHLTSLCDLMLDPYPFGGGNTTYEALAFGVPVVTLPTSFLRGRITRALYEIIGVEDCIARDADHYIDLAVSLGTDPLRRRGISERIHAASGGLFENPAGVRALEDFFREVVAKV